MDTALSNSVEPGPHEMPPPGQLLQGSGSLMQVKRGPIDSSILRRLCSGLRRYADKQPDEALNLKTSLSNCLNLPALMLAVCALSACKTTPPVSFSDLDNDARNRSGYRLESRGWATEAPALAESILSNPLTLRDAVQLALINSPAIQARLADFDIDLADWQRAATLRNPHMSVSVKAPSGRGEPSIEFELLAPLVDLILMPMRKDLASSQLASQRLKVSDAVIELSAHVESAWIDYLAAREKLRIAQGLADTGQLGAELAARFDTAGNLQPRDRIHSDELAAMGKLRLSWARQDHQLARLELSRLMGLSRESDWTTEQSLSDVADMPDETLLRRELARHPAVLAAKEQQGQFAAALGIQRRFRGFGHIDVGIAYEREDFHPQMYGLAFEMGIPVFDRNDAEIAAASARLNRAGWSLDAIELELDYRMQAALVKLGSAHEQALLYRDAIIPGRRAMVEAAQREYNYMLLGVFDLIEVRQMEYQAMSQHIDAVAAFWHAAADLRWAAGGQLNLDREAPISYLILPSGLPEHQHLRANPTSNTEGNQ